MHNVMPASWPQGKDCQRGSGSENNVRRKAQKEGRWRIAPTYSLRVVIGD